MKSEVAGIRTSPSWLATAYGMTIVLALALFFVIRAFGESLSAPTAGGPAMAAGSAPPAAKADALLHVSWHC
jgi:hypothetical protein